MKTNSEKYKDPRWQKKRLQIFERDKWTCRFCNETSKTLHVHHRRYDKGASPWEYDDWLLVTLCDACHEQISTQLADIQMCINERKFSECLGELLHIYYGDRIHLARNVLITLRNFLNISNAHENELNELSERLQRLEKSHENKVQPADNGTTIIASGKDRTA